MVRLRSWQRGAADLVTLGTSLAVLAIVFAGTAASFQYGREALTREEHYKAAAYILRSKMEEVQAGIQMIDAARDGSRSNNLLSEFDYPPIPLENNLGRERAVYVYVHRYPVTEFDLIETGPGTDYFILKMKASWRYRDMAENTRSDPGKLDELTFTTAFAVRG